MGREETILNLIDSHAHLFLSEFDADLPAVISRAHESGVTGIICAGVDIPSSRQAIALAGSYPAIFASVGIHPQSAVGTGKEDLDRLIEMAGMPRVVAIGEIGLDYYHGVSPPEVQRDIFEAQLKLAQKTALPVVIHCRRAEEDLLEILGRWQGRVSGVIHCFSSAVEVAWRYFDLGFCISLGAYLGYPTSGRLREDVSKLPLDMILLETDSPFLPPQQYRGRRNEPAYITEVALLLANSYRVSPEKVAEETSRNAARLFRFKLKG